VGKEEGEGLEKKKWASSGGREDLKRLVDESPRRGLNSRP